MNRIFCQLIICICILSAGCANLSPDPQNSGTASTSESNLVDNPQYAGAVVTIVRYANTSLQRDFAGTLQKIKNGNPAFKLNDRIYVWIYDIEGNIIVSPSGVTGLPDAKVGAEIIKSAMHDDEGWLQATAQQNGRKVQRKFFYNVLTTKSSRKLIICSGYFIQ